MGARSAGRGRGRGEVVPITDDDEPDSYSPLDKRQRREQSPTRAPALRRRLLPARGWLGVFLMLNIVAVAGFIFSSAWYFPSTSTAGVVEQAIKQGDVSLVELSPREDPREEEGEDVGEDAAVPPSAPVDPATSAPALKPATTSSSLPEPTQEPKTRLRSEVDSATTIDEVGVVVGVVVTQPSTVEMKPLEPASDSPIVTDDVLTNHPSTVMVSDPIDTETPVSDVAQQQPVETASSSPLSVPDATPSVSVVRSQSMEDLLRQMKIASESPSVMPKDEVTAAVVTAENPEREDDQEEEGQEVLPAADTAPTHDGGLETNLVVWMKADQGVEVENAAECEALGTACEVTSWKSVVGQQAEPVAFQPVDARMRPVLQSASYNDLPVVSFSCGMVHTSGFVLRETMTLFFVLSPSQIEQGDTYAAQKFFGNAPYGQFLLHGGRPAFFTSGGLVESSFVASNNQLLLVTYRLHRHAVEIKTNGPLWTPKQAEEDAFQVRLSGNAALSLGNVKGVCDTNAFQGGIAEVLIYDTVLSDHRVDAVEQYLLRKWWGEERSERPKEGATKPGQEDPDELVVETTADAQADAADEATPIEQDQFDLVRPQENEEPLPEEADELPASPLKPRAFDPEGVFEWLPSAELLTLIASEQGTDPSPIVEKWKRAVSEKVAIVRNFQFGGEILRSFIRERRDELLTLREELFGG